MGDGPQDGTVVDHVALTPPDPDRVADLLLALGFEPSRHWPRRMFSDVDGAVSLTLGPPGEPEGLSSASWTMSWEEPDEPAVTIALSVASGALASVDLDDLRLITRPDRRRFAAATLVPTTGSQDVAARADAWVEALVASGLGSIEECEPTSARPTPTSKGAARSPGPRSRRHPADQRQSGAAHPARRPGGRRSAWAIRSRCWSVSPSTFRGTIAHQVGRIDDAFVLALSGGVFAVRGRRPVGGPIARRLEQHRQLRRPGEQEQWLEQAAAGRRTDGVVPGDALA